MRSAFTLIEVMVSVVIISFVSVGLFGLQNNTTHNLELIKKQRHLALVASPLLVREDINLHNKTRTLYDFLKERYNLRYDTMIEALKNTTLTYTQEEFAFISLDEEVENTVGMQAPKVGLKISKIVVKSTTSSARVYSFEAMQ